MSEHEEHVEVTHTLPDSTLNLVPLAHKVALLKEEIGKVIVGQESLVEMLVVALLANGHVLIEGVPGIAKTLSVKVLAKAVSTGFSRIQFTPDLMPTDVTGTTVFNLARSEFEFKPGPLFSNLILIDEINRAPAKTQSALFEVMEERQITVDGHTYPMATPFLVLATQNPIEHEGTYRLPEAQLDRFMFKICIDYPSLDDECAILANENGRTNPKPERDVKAIISPDDLAAFRQLIQKVHIEDNLMRYIAEIVHKTRNHGALFLGASPRASICILQSAKVFAAIQGRDFVIPEDIVAVVQPVLVHRVTLTPEKELEGVQSRQIIDEIVRTVAIPR